MQPELLAYVRTAVHVIPCIFCFQTTTGGHGEIHVYFFYLGTQKFLIATKL